MPPAETLRPLTSPAARVTALLRSDTLLLINPDIVRPASPGFSLAPLFRTGLSAVGDPGTPLRPGEVRILQCRRTEAIPGGGWALTRPWAEATRIAVEAVEPGGAFPAKTVVGPDFTVSADIFGEGHDVLAADLLWQPVDEPGLAAHADAKAGQRPVGGLAFCPTGSGCTGSRWRDGGTSGARLPTTCGPRWPPART